MDTETRELLQRSVKLERIFTRGEHWRTREYFRLRARFLALPGYSIQAAEERASMIAYADA